MTTASDTIRRLCEQFPATDEREHREKVAAAAAAQNLNPGTVRIQHRKWWSVNVQGKKQKGAAMVVLSGGQDSTTCLWWAKKHYDTVHAVTFDYGQRHSLEISAATKLAALAEVASHVVVRVGPILDGRSPLTDQSQPLEQYQNHEQMEQVIGDRVELTFVPMRNGLFLTLAANRAICKDCKTLVTGVCEADNANYPDCRATFVRAMERMVNLALGIEDFVIAAPLLTLSKPKTVKLLHDMGEEQFASLAFSHTSYDGKYPPTDMNHANVLRAEGFKEAGLPDPLVLRALNEGLMPLPATDNYGDPILNGRITALVEVMRKRLV